MSGVKVAEHGLVGAMGVATKDVPPFNVVAGVPAKTVRVKTIAPERLQGTGDRGQGKNG
jgi:acetyltransferase-like isoleucine patch superfamily enzyme